MADSGLALTLVELNCPKFEIIETCLARWGRGVLPAGDDLPARVDEWAVSGPDRFTDSPRNRRL